jgi:hypothetical protein
MSLEQIATSGVAIDTSGHHRRIRTNRFSDHFSPDTASTNHCALTRPTEVSNIILCLHLRQTTKPHMSFGTLVRFGSTAEVALSDCDVRFYPQTKQVAQSRARLVLRAKN